MSELFGIPVAGLAVVLAALVVVVLAVVAALAVRNRVLFKVGVRNMARRPGRTAIIVSGLMLGTMIIGSALGFGDIMSSTVRSSVITSLGQTDEVVAARSADAPDIATLGVGSSARYLTQSEAATLVEAARALPDVDGVAPAISEPVAVQDISSRTTEPQVTLFATDPAAMEGFGAITTTTGQQVSLGDLVGDQVYINADAAEDLGAAAGDQLSVSAAGRVLAVIVRDVVEYDGTGTDGGALLAQLTVGQRAVGAGTDVQQVMISNVGDEISGAESTDAVVQSMQSTVDRLGLQIEPVKRDGLEQADEEGAAYLSMFSTMGTFTISAGILLIFLVFVMLAAERRGEMGTARAIGTQRRHLVQAFVFEGFAYDVLAAVVGAVLGLALSVAMVWMIAGALSDLGLLTIRYDLTWTSLVVAFSLGVLLTLLVVVVAAWRISRLNIVAAVRNLPQPPRRLRRRSQGILVVVCLGIGGALVALSYPTESAAALMVGGTCLLLSVVPLTRLLGGGDRLAYTLAGVAVLVWNLLPFSFYEALVPGLRMGFSVWVVVGLLLVAGSTWVVIYNTRALMDGLMWLFGRSRRAAPVVRTAIAQPTRSPFRTGSMIGLFTLVVFTLVTGASTSSSFLAAINDEESFGGGYDVTAQTSPLSPITNMRSSIAQSPELSAEIAASAAQSYVPIEARQVGQPDFAAYVVRGLDDAFAQTTTYGFATRAHGYGSDEEIWQALATEPGLAVVDAFSVPRRTNWGTAVVSDFQLEGFYFEDDGFEPVPIEVHDTQSGARLKLKVIGVFSDTVPTAMLGISTSQRNLAPFGTAAVPSVWYYQVTPGSDPEEVADELEAAFVDNGMQASAQSEVLHDAVGASLTFQYLILGFLALGLVIGVAALGVVTARSVVERRQQIGVMRAIGFQARMVQMSFLVESLFVTMVGVVLGTVLGLVVALNVVVDSASQPGWENLELRPPWAALAVILLVVVTSSVVTTWLPSLKASRTYPAAALRYE